MSDDTDRPVRERTPQRKVLRLWGLVTAIGALTVVGLAVYLVAATGRQDEEIRDSRQLLTAQSAVIDKQNDVIGQVCKVAGGQVNADPSARSYCERVESGLPAVERPVTATVPEPRGIEYARQDGRCWVSIGFTDGSVNRVGPFCGADGAPGTTGPSGPPGATGEAGRPGAQGTQGETGADGVGIADVRTTADGCHVEVEFTDDRPPRVLGPFCGAPVESFTMTGPDGSRQRCVRDGDSDPARPHYVCAVESTTTTPPAPTTTTTTTPPPVTTTQTTEPGVTLVPTR